MKRQQVQTLLCVDDDVDSCDLVRFIFENYGYRVVTYNNPIEAVRLARLEKFDAIILDYRMPEMDGTDVCRTIRTFDKRVPIVFFTASAQEKDRVKILASGAQAFLLKPNDLDVLTETVQSLIQPN